MTVILIAFAEGDASNFKIKETGMLYYQSEIVQLHVRNIVCLDLGLLNKTTMYSLLFKYTVRDNKLCAVPSYLTQIIKVVGGQGGA